MKLNPLTKRVIAAGKVGDDRELELEILVSPGGGALCWVNLPPLESELGDGEGEAP